MRQAEAGLLAKIDGLLGQNTSQENRGRFFMKLSTRSPKDYCWDYRQQDDFDRAVHNLIIYLK